MKLKKPGTNLPGFFIWEGRDMHYVWTMARCPLCKGTGKAYIDHDRKYPRDGHHLLVLCRSCIFMYRPDVQFYMMDLEHLNECLQKGAINDPGTQDDNQGVAVEGVRQCGPPTPQTDKPRRKGGRRKR